MTNLLVHIVGDYFLQSSWMAVNKSKQFLPCFIHVLIYTSTFYLSMKLGIIKNNLLALIPIGITHFFIDRYRLAKYLCYSKNFMSPRSEWKLWKDCQPFGFYKDDQFALVLWLFIIIDNTTHLIINELSLKLL